MCLSGSIGSLVLGIIIFTKLDAAGCFTVKNETGVTELRQMVQELSGMVTKLNHTLHKEKHQNVMFFAVIQGKTYTYNVDANVIFETVIVNEGGHYNKYDGVFVAPVAGTYFFSWTVSGSGSTYIITELVVENNVISSTGQQSGSSGFTSASMTSFVKMKVGEHAWIRTTGASTGHVLHSQDNYPQSAFLGWLIYSD